MQVTVVICNVLLSSRTFLFITHSVWCGMWPCNCPTTRAVALDEWYLLHIFFFPFLLFPFLSQQQPCAGMNYLTKGSSSACQWKMQEHLFMELDLFYRNKSLEITITFQGLEQEPLNSYFYWKIIVESWLMPVGSGKELLLSVLQTFWCVFWGFFCSW